MASVSSNRSICVDHLIHWLTLFVFWINCDGLVAADHLGHYVAVVDLWRRAILQIDLQGSLVDVGHTLPIAYFFLLALQLSDPVTSFRMNIFDRFLSWRDRSCLLFQADDFCLLQLWNIHRWRGPALVATLLAHSRIVQLGTACPYVHAIDGHCGANEMLLLGWGSQIVVCFLGLHFNFKLSNSV